VERVYIKEITFFTDTINHHMQITLSDNIKGVFYITARPTVELTLKAAKSMFNVFFSNNESYRMTDDRIIKL